MRCLAGIILPAPGGQDDTEGRAFRFLVEGDGAVLGGINHDEVYY